MTSEQVSNTVLISHGDGISDTIVLSMQSQWRKGTGEMEETNESAARLGVSFEAYHLRLRIYRSIIDKLNNPKYIKLLVNVEKKRLAITESKKKKDSFEIPEFKADDSFEINSKHMVRMIYDLCNWEYEKNYRVFGRYFTDANVIEFSLADAEIINDEGVAGENDATSPQ